MVRLFAMKVEFTSSGSLYEKIPYDLPDYPVYVLHDHLFNSWQHRVLLHCHADFEFVLVTKGSMDYYANGVKTELHEGDGIFTNSGRVHYARLPEDKDCWFTSILFHPGLLCSSGLLEKEHVQPLIANSCFPYLKLDGKDPVFQDLLSCLHDLARHPICPETRMQVQSDIFAVFYRLESFCPKGPAANVQSESLSAFQKMLNYVQEQYAENISLKDICQAGSVGKTVCCALFSRYGGQSPMHYVQTFRLEKACQLLLSERSILQISLETGFSSAGYFSQCFRKRFGMSPKEWRETCKNSQDSAA